MMVCCNNHGSFYLTHLTKIFLNIGFWKLHFCHVCKGRCILLCLGRKENAYLEP